MCACYNLHPYACHTPGPSLLVPSKHTIGPNDVSCRLGPFSSLLLPLLEATDTFGHVVMAVVVMVVMVIVVVVVVHRLCGFSLPVVITNNLKKIISKEKEMKKMKKTYQGLKTQTHLEPWLFVVCRHEIMVMGVPVLGYGHVHIWKVTRFTFSLSFF